ncbi:MAG: FAD:protein FMN transferase [Candidatus Riflebacteria bacterium]|nr:FAD:protein FMN transferase [Candidatus Riflebacteria bacterium]
MKKTLLTSLILIASLLLYLHNDSNKPISESRFMMDTVITIKAWPPNAQNAINAGFKVFDEIEDALSFHREKSKLSILNNSFQTTKSEHLNNIIDLSLKYHEITEGYFDPSFAIINKLYGFYGNIPSQLPDKDLIKSTITQFTGLTKVLSFDKDNVYLKKGAKIDFGGIAGGYAINLASQAMINEGCQTFLIDDAGDIKVMGTKPDESEWAIAVLNPVEKSFLATAKLPSSMCISTSGNYERFVEINNKKYGHIMNPLTGFPAEEFISVSVIAKTPEEADIMSTALFAMPENLACKKAEELSIPALFLTADLRVIISAKGNDFFTRNSKL